VARMDRPDHLEPLVHQSLEDEVRRDLVLDPGPHLVRVHEREPWPTALGPAAQHESGLVVQDVGPLRVHVVPEVTLEVVSMDRLDGGPDVRRRQQVPEVEESRVELPQELVGQTADPMLVGMRVHVVRALE